jgi:hypothetical protein
MRTANTVSDTGVVVGAPSSPAGPTPGEDRNGDPSKMALVITDLGQLHRLSRKSKPARIILRLPVLSAHETVEWERRINSAANGCGCGEGAAFLLTALVLLGFLTASLWPVVRLNPISTGLIASVLILGSVAAGKSFGKARAARQLRGSVDGLRAILENRSPECRVASSMQPRTIPQGGLR